MNDVAILAYADWRGFVNSIREMRRHPARLFVWAVYLGSILIVGATRLILVSQHHQAFAMANEDTLAAGVVLFFAIVLARGNQPPSPFFDHACEARMIVSSTISPRIAVLYLQVRNAIDLLLRFSLSLTYIFILMAPTNASPASLIAEFLYLSITIGAIVLIPLPRELASAPIRAVLSAVGWILVALTGITVIRSLISGLSAFAILQHLLARVPQPHLGTYLRAIMSGDVRPTIIVVTLAGLGFLALLALADDAYPELFEISTAAWEFRSWFRARLRGHAGGRSISLNREPVRSGSGKHVPTSSGVGLWTEWTAYRRQAKPWRIALITIGLFCVGIVFGATHALRIEAVGQVAFVVLMVFFASGMFAGLKVVAEVRRPLWWLGTVPPSRRLIVIVLAQTWRMLIGIGVTAAGLLIGGAAPVIVGLFVAMAAAGAWLQRTIGLFTVVLFPRTRDLRGPANLIRLLFLYALGFPPVAVAGTILILARKPVDAVYVGALIAIFEGLLLIGATTRNLVGRIDRLSSS